MEDQPKPNEASAPDKPAASPAPIKVEDLAEAAASMNRFLTKFAKLQPFESEISVADWMFLMILSIRKEGRTHHQAFLLGFPYERVQKISEKLIQAGLVASAESTDPSRPGVQTIITEAGTERLNALNTALMPLLSKVLAGGNEGTLAALKHHMHILLRVVM